MELEANAPDDFDIGPLKLTRRKKISQPSTPFGSAASSSKSRVGIKIADDDDDEKKAYKRRKRREENGEEAVIVQGRTEKTVKGFVPVGEHKQVAPVLEPKEDAVPKKRGGLRTAAEVAAEAEAAKAREREEYAKEEVERLARLKESGEHQVDPATETVYRDASGRRLDLKEEAVRLRRADEEAKRLEQAKKDWNKGQAQQVQKRKAQQDLEKMKTTNFSRYANDEDMNDEMKDKMLWNDPAATFLSRSSKKDKGPIYPQYQGPPPPTNRFGILPGYRWDGVDRGNGFEKKLFAMRYAQKSRQEGVLAAETDDL